MGAYIINIPDSVDRIIYINVNPMNGKTYLASYSVDELTPYTAPDLEQVRQVRMEAYEQGRKDGKIEGRAEMWDAARKIAGMTLEEQGKIFGTVTLRDIISKFTASEVIEKLKAYEQEKTKVEYNFEEVKDVIETTAKEYNMSLDEIAEVLHKMGEING